MVADCISIDFDFCIELSDKKFEDYEDAEGDTKWLGNNDEEGKICRMPL